MSCVFHSFASLYCCLVVTCREKADLLALVCEVNCVFVTFPCSILGQVWYLIVSIPDFCCLSYYDHCVIRQFEVIMFLDYLNIDLFLCSNITKVIQNY